MEAQPSPSSSRAKPRDLQFRGPFLGMFFDGAKHYREVMRGDVVVFYKPTEQPNGEHIFLVKRVIGIPGDHISRRRR
jgi:hypothetical protein